MSELLLDVRGVSAGYSRRTKVLNSIDLQIERGQSVGVTGMNGAGKSTLLKVVAGQLRLSSGSIEFLGRVISRDTASARTRAGLVSLPEGHQVLKSLTVIENLRLATGCLTTRGADAALRGSADEIYSLFPILQERRDQLAGLLSGGEQQMLSLSRAIVLKPKLLVLDEPSLGLAPVIVNRIYEAIAKLRATGVSLLVVEQGSHMLRGVCDELIVLNKGEITMSGGIDSLSHAQIQNAYFA
ncbi:ABC transporter ATP-binding protein [Pseudarthrobacter sp. NIBRBAC000502772]|uniref:ABC transporter ATP-binding protein n=1 Tax=Pseudarthrobacter sp. NIBRBAC000502772 TaxID=2590775 RepID=UPI001131B92D|nr:ABC transporter ATP-binding protein [Pseudarthrobacter sp. NIBRBAC000502772]QDG66705.1 ABC transporter ATP-binding protein [Pseudarthrobacter sp. NIBRBAC000502772]